MFDVPVASNSALLAIFDHQVSTEPILEEGLRVVFFVEWKADHLDLQFERGNRTNE